MPQSWQKFFDWEHYDWKKLTAFDPERFTANILYWQENYEIMSMFFVFALSLLSTLVRHDIWGIAILVAAASAVYAAKKKIMKPEFLPLLCAGSYLLSFLVCC